MAFYHEVLEWLRENDPDEKLVASPGDLLALCADFDARGSDRASLHERATRWLRDAGPNLFPQEVPLAWVRELFVDTVRAMAVRHFDGINDPFGALQRDQWAAEIPAELSSGDPRATLGALQVAGYLRAAGILRGAQQGLTLYPSWVRNGLVGDTVEQRCASGAAGTWGRWAADNGRQGIVDTALDALDDGAFFKLVRRVAGESREPTLARVAAIDTACAAAARRCWRTGFVLPPSESPFWSDLLRLELESLAAAPQPNEPSARLPFTRRDREEWLATAWTLSVHVPSPRGFQTGELAWVVPGWAKSLLLSGLQQANYQISRWSHSGRIFVSNAPRTGCAC